MSVVMGAFWRRMLLVAGLSVLFAAAALWLIAGALMAPSQRKVARPPDLTVEDVAFDSSSGSRIHGWFIPGRADEGVVLLLHGVRADRTVMLPRAQFLHAAGYNVLLIDQQAHGESVAPCITFGALEAKDVSAALNFLTQRLPGVPIGVIGVSLGGAALVLSEPKGRVAAVVLESVYPTIEQAVANRLQNTLGPSGPWLTPLLLWQLAPRTGIAPERLRPFEHIAQLGAPLLLLHGDADRSTRLPEAQQLFAAAQEPKTMWIISGAAHVDLHRFVDVGYERRILEFFAAHLQR